MSRVIHKALPLTAVQEYHACLHCGKALLHAAQDPYCCSGCRAAKALIAELDLADYYRLAAQADGSVPVGRIEAQGAHALLDEPVWRASHCRPCGTSSVAIELDVEGLTCYACVWLLERALARRFSGVSARFNLARGSCELQFDPKRQALSEVVALFAKLGYGVSPRAAGSSPLRALVLRLGLAVFCALNVMALAAADYVAPDGSLDPFYGRVFRWLSLLLTVPCVGYAGVPFFKSARLHWREKRIGIDVPIAVAILVTFAYSVVNAWRDAGPVYFDSITAGIALLLTGRVLQTLALTRAERAIVGYEDDAARFTVRRDACGREATIEVKDVRPGDVLMIKPGQSCPVAATVERGASEIDLASTTGEARPDAVSVGAHVPSGALNGSGLLQVRALEYGQATYWEGARQRIAAMLGEKGRYAQLVDRLATGFYVVVTAAAVVAFAVSYRRVGVEAALARAMAALLIACPCAFGFAAPLTFAAHAARALRRGVAFRDQRAIERLAGVERVFFDKTGTLTQGKLSVTKVLTLEAEPFLQAVAKALGQASTHHVAQALAVWAGDCVPAELSNVEERFGFGITAEFAGRRVALGSHELIGCDPLPGYQSYLAIDAKLVAAYALEDVVQEDARALVGWLAANGIEVGVLSGDAPLRTQALAAELGIEAAEGGLSPDDKAARLTVARGGLARTAMVGNGANDGLAMARSALGIAVQGASDAARDASDVYLLRRGVGGVATAIAASRAAVGGLRRTFVFAGAYNVLGLSLAVTGHVSPGVAAVLMPLSSLAIIWLSTRVGTEGAQA